MDQIKKAVIALSLAVPVLTFSIPVSAGSGSDTVWQMKYYYSRTPQDCGKERPLDQCSGLRMRGTDSMKSFEPWDPSPNSVASGGISMSFMRQDIKYEDLGLRKKNGFILKPNDFIADSEKKISTLCFFPMDAWTDYRNEQGCGNNRNTPNYIERTCQGGGITNADQWLKEYRKVRNDHQKQCGFEIRDRKDAAEAYWQGVLARQKIKDDRDAIATQTEIRVPTWKDDEDAELPIMAFIYTPNNRASGTEGLREAKDDQQRYFAKTGKWVPVIRVDLPKSNTQEALFSYSDADQSTAIPTVKNECKSYIESATWSRREDPNIKGAPWSLMIEPTACGRNMTKEQQPAAYAELFSKYGNSPNWNPDNGSMWQQFVCHLEWSGQINGTTVRTRDKETWNLEPVRPRASWDDVFKEGCNAYSR